MVYATRRANLTSGHASFLAALMVITLVTPACRGRRQGGHARQGGDAGLALEVEIGGCAALVRRAGLVCESSPGSPLRLVLPESASAVVVVGQGKPLPTSRVDGAPAHVVLVTVPPAVPALSITARLGGAELRYGATIIIAPVTSAPWLEDARARRMKGDADGARELLREHLAHEDPALRALATGTLARVELAAGEVDKAIALLGRAIDDHRMAGRVSDVADDSFALAFALNQRSHRYAEARAVLDGVSRDFGGFAEGRARLAYYRGVVAAETGDHRTALLLLREAESRAKMLGMDRLERNAASTIGVEMQAVGRAAASLERLAQLAAHPDLVPCERAGIENNLGWGALLANESLDQPRYDARGPLERSLAVVGCPDVYERAFALGSLARLALREGDLARAETALREARAAVREPRGTDRLAWLELDGHIAVARGRAHEALAMFDDLLAKARAAALLVPEWSAHVGRAAALEKLGKTDAAITALQTAERLVDDALMLVPLGEGRSFFASDTARVTRSTISLLVARGRLAEGAAVARRSHARVLSSVARSLTLERLTGSRREAWDAAIGRFRHARAAIDVEAARDWELAADALSAARAARGDKERELRSALDAAMALVAGERTEPADSAARAVKRPPRVMDVTVHPAREGWLVFIETPDDKTTVARVPTPSTERSGLERALTVAITPHLDRADTLHFMGFGAARAIDVHALPLPLALAGGGDVPLGARVAVDYPLGLSLPRPDETPRHHAAVIGDPTGDLPEALAEARDVAGVLGALGPVRLLVRDQATSADVGQLLLNATMLHYAGHGKFGGLDGMESGLPLAKGGTLTIGDILAAAPVPPRVLLAGCEAARSEGDVEGLGIAQSFVVAGAREVLAPVRTVADGLARRFATETARALTAGAPSLAEAARRAAFTVRGGDPNADWAAFRVVTR